MRDCSCLQCKKQKPVMVEMKPGHDGRPWFLCASCYVGNTTS